MKTLSAYLNYRNEGYVHFDNREIIMRINILGNDKGYTLFLKGFHEVLFGLINKKTGINRNDDIFEVNYEKNI